MAKSPFYQLKLHGEAPAQSTWVMPIPNDSEPYETLDVYTWEPQSQSWQWLPHNIIREDDLIESTSNAVPLSAMVMQTNPKPALVAADVAQAKDLPAESQGALAQVHPTGLYLGGNGAIDGAVDATFDQAAGAYAVMPVIRNYEGPDRALRPAGQHAGGQCAARRRTSTTWSTWRSATCTRASTLTTAGWTRTCAASSTSSSRNWLKSSHAQGKELSVRVEPAVQVAEDRWETGPYDWQTLGLLADTVKVPAPQDPNAYVPDGQLDALVRYAVGQINRSKLQYRSRPEHGAGGQLPAAQELCRCAPAAAGSRGCGSDGRRAGQAVEPGAGVEQAHQRAGVRPQHRHLRLPLPG